MWAGWVHRSWRFGHVEALHEVGPKITERGSKISTVPVVWATVGIFSVQSKCFSVVIGDHVETWLYHYDPETKQQSMEWRHSGSPHPKKFRVQKSTGKFSPRFFGIKTASSSLIFQRAKLSTPSITYLCWYNWRTFSMKNAARSSPKESCSCTTIPWVTGHLQPRRNWPTWASNVLITHRILQIWPCRNTTCSLDWKNQLKVRHFLSDAEVIAAAETWLDGQLSDFFFWVGCKSYNKGLGSVLNFVGSMLNKSRVWSL